MSIGITASDAATITMASPIGSDIAALVLRGRGHDPVGRVFWVAVGPVAAKWPIVLAFWLHWKLGTQSRRAVAGDRC